MSIDTKRSMALMFPRSEGHAGIPVSSIGSDRSDSDPIYGQLINVESHIEDGLVAGDAEDALIVDYILSKESDDKSNSRSDLFAVCAYNGAFRKGGGSRFANMSLEKREEIIEKGREIVEKAHLKNK